VEEIGKATHEAGMKFQLWFEPTRVHEGTAIFRDHPEWLVGPGPGVMKTNYLYDLGNPAALDWIVDHISERIKKFHVDVYWSDFCFDDPLFYWQHCEDPDRQGINKIKWVEGFYQHWDELLKRHPHLLINNCAGGGRTIDLELMKRSIPLWTSDFQANGDPTIVGNQGHSFGSFYWLPLSGIGVNRPTTYDFRSNMRGGISFRCWLNEAITADFPHEWVREMLSQYNAVREYYYGDIYPLTDYSLWESDWLTYQMHRPDLDEGMVVAFRRLWCDDESQPFKLRGLNEDALYLLKNLDTGAEERLDGRKLMTDGLEVKIDQRPSSALITYSRAE
jgi:alpha-galactosidase